MFGHEALFGAEQVDVGADLEHRPGLHVARQLGVRHLVVVRTPGARPLGIVHPKQEVRVPAPTAVEEGRLVDDVRTGGHGLARFLGRGPQLRALVLDRAIARDLDDGPALRPQLGQVALLVLLAPPPEDVQLRVVDMWSPHQPGQRRAFEGGEVLAFEVSDQIGGGVDRLPVNQLHGRIVAPGCDG